MYNQKKKRTWNGRKKKKMMMMKSVGPGKRWNRRDWSRRCPKESTWDGRWRWGRSGRASPDGWLWNLHNKGTEPRSKGTPSQLDQHINVGVQVEVESHCPQPKWYSKLWNMSDHHQDPLLNSISSTPLSLFLFVCCMLTTCVYIYSWCWITKMHDSNCQLFLGYF